MIVSLQTVAPYVQSGKLRMLAVMSAERSEAFPEVPDAQGAGSSGPRGGYLVRRVRSGGNEQGGSLRS